MKSKIWCPLYISNLFLFFLCLSGGIKNSLNAQPATKAGLFDADEVIEITLSGNIRAVLNDRTGKPKKYSSLLSVQNKDIHFISFPVELQTRGNYRRMKENCNYPPLWIHFSKTGDQLNSVFKEQNKMKLVMPCQSDEYVIREWLVYKLYNLLTPLSFKARLVKIKLEDPKIKKPVDPFYALLLEEEKQMAGRNNLLAVEKKLKPEETQTDIFLLMAVFEYFIGNTDWSVQYMHNVKLVSKNEKDIPLTVPYDFDHAGIVSAPYAHPADELQLKSVRERRFRGYCIKDLNKFDTIIEQFNSLKNDIYNVYKNCELLDAKYIRSTLQYLDDFYKTINNPKEWQKEFGYPCDENGTGNIVIKGMKEN